MSEVTLHLSDEDFISVILSKEEWEKLVSLINLELVGIDQWSSERRILLEKIREDIENELNRVE